MTIKENIGYLSYFGFDLTIKKTCNAIMKNIFGGGIGDTLQEMNNTAIEKYLENLCVLNVPSEKQSLLYHDFINPDVPYNNVIWTMWWQGEENAPAIIKHCINSMRKNNNGHPVIVLDENNWNQYVRLPDIIMDRYKTGKTDNNVLKNIVLDETHLSDIIRCLLLIQYGGLWMDASIYVSSPIDEKLFQETWSTLGQDNENYIGKGKWSTFFMGTLRGSELMKKVYEMHICYWMQKKYYVNYLMFDHMIDLCCKRNPQFQAMIDHVQTGNKKCLDVNRYRDEWISAEDWKKFLEHQHFHKLSWRWWGREKDAEWQHGREGSYLERLFLEENIDE